MRHPECKGGTARLRHKIESDRVGQVGNLRPIGNRPYKRRRITNPPLDAILSYIETICVVALLGAKKRRRHSS
jgi:hypothetical protein